MSETGLKLSPNFPVSVGLTREEIDANGPAMHLPVTVKVLNFMPAADFVIEFGCGEYSTDVFLRAGRQVISVETDLEWVNRISTKHAAQLESGQLRMMCARKPTGELGIFKAMGYGKDGKFANIAFVDGPHTTRLAIAQTLVNMDMASAIICHDTERPEYGWARLALPEEWRFVEVRDYKIWTGVLCAPGMHGLVKRLQDAFSNVHTYKLLELAEKEFIKSE